MPNDTYITVGARYALWVIITVGAVALTAGTAYQAYALERQLAADARR
ncbi:hypothetical protein [Rhizobium phage RHph_X2_25]|nr:hypothetical protein [Rhizobium phage RHph_X2_25]